MYLYELKIKYLVKKIRYFKYFLKIKYLVKKIVKKKTWQTCHVFHTIYLFFSYIVSFCFMKIQRKA